MNADLKTNSNIVCDASFIEEAFDMPHWTKDDAFNNQKKYDSLSTQINMTTLAMQDEKTFMLYLTEIVFSDPHAAIISIDETITRRNREFTSPGSCVADNFDLFDRIAKNNHPFHRNGTGLTSCVTVYDLLDDNETAPRLMQIFIHCRTVHHLSQQLIALERKQHSLTVELAHTLIISRLKNPPDPSVLREQRNPCFN